ncbi:MAG: hypothetical protein JNK09_11360 [Prolixibacteraceae bacterium]|nr:hypothetical protein [Prolixibacteraceae bacterium]
MKTTLSILCVVGTILLSFGQDKNFDLSRYKFPDYKRHELEFNFNSDGNSQRYYSIIPATSNYSGVNLDRSNSSFNSTVNISYQFENFSRKRIDRVTSGLSGKYLYEKSKYPEESSKLSEPQAWGFLQTSRRNYITEDKIFWEGLAYLKFNSSWRKITYESTPNLDEYTSSSQSISAGVGIGKGRIESVNDLWQGYYILEKLKKQNSLDRDLNEQDIFEFASFISKLKNKRFFDYRLRKIAELKALDSILHKQNLIKNSNIAYFSTLNDYWSFPIYFDRKSGKEIKLAITPEYSRNYFKSNSIAANTPAVTNLISTLEFDYSKQGNLFWERNFKIGFNNTTLLAKNGDVEENLPNNLIGTNVSYGFGFFPDSRTRIQLTSRYSGNQSTNYTGEDMKIGWMNNFVILFQLAYFISPQIQIAGDFNGRYWQSNLNSWHGHNINYSLALRYAIF